MNMLFRSGDQKIFEKTVSEADTARFDTGEVHPVYSTFALARDMEWACRLFVLDMKEGHEEGIGVSLSIEHEAPALVGTPVRIVATVREITGNRIDCGLVVWHGERRIASGTQRQRILSKERISTLFTNLAGDLS